MGRNCSDFCRCGIGRQGKWSIVSTITSATYKGRALLPQAKISIIQAVEEEQAAHGEGEVAAVTTGKRSDISARTRDRSIPASTNQVHRLRRGQARYHLAAKSNGD